MGTWEGFRGVPNMETRVSTVIIEPRLVIREALELLMRKHSCRVVCGIASTGDIANWSSISDGPELVIMGAQAANSAAKDAEVIRIRWPDSKIVFLFDDASSSDFQNMLVSQIDGCIPPFVSPETLMRTLDLILAENARILVMGRYEALFKVPRSRTAAGGEQDAQTALERSLVWGTAVGAFVRRGEYTRKLAAA